jgi:hypothetical protein
MSVRGYARARQYPSTPVRIARARIAIGNISQALN